jgi:hypothetical protein
MVYRRSFLSSIAGAVGLVFLSVVPCFAQLGMFTKEQRLEITREWKADRFDDGRTKLPDEVLNRLKDTTAEQAWATLRKQGYHLQFEGNWKTINVKPGERLIGRAVTVQFVPLRPSTLVKGDVMVVDLYGKIKDGTIIGDNLSTSMATKTGTGLVVNGAIREPSGLSEITGSKVFTRDFDRAFWPTRRYLAGTFSFESDRQRCCPETSSSAIRTVSCSFRRN